MSKGVKQRPRIGKRIKDSADDNSQLFSMMRRLESPSAISVPSFSGVSGGSNTGSTSSSFLPTAGGTMIGPIAFFPKLITISSGTIDVGEATDDFTSRVIVTPESGSTDDLVTISNAKHAGQILFLQGIQTDTLTLKTTGNIETIDGNDFSLADDDNIILIFDSIDNKWQQVTTGKQGTLGTVNIWTGVNTFTANSFSVSSTNIFLGDASSDTINITGTMKLSGGDNILSSSATEIGYQVGNEALTVGSEGSMILPYIANATNAPSDATLDGWFGDVNGAIGLQRYTITPNNRIWYRLNGTWFKNFAT